MAKHFFKIKKYKINKLVFFDKDENSLADLNREINLNYNFKIKREYICQDLNDININKFLISGKFTHFLNFAALKHVRSEENFYSMRYLVKTNCISPFNLGNLNKIKSLRKIFFISLTKLLIHLALWVAQKNLWKMNYFG